MEFSTKKREENGRGRQTVGVFFPANVTPAARIFFGVRRFGEDLPDLIRRITGGQELHGMESGGPLFFGWIGPQRVRLRLSGLWADFMGLPLESIAYNAQQATARAAAENQKQKRRRIGRAAFRAGVIRQNLERAAAGLPPLKMPPGI